MKIFEVIGPHQNKELELMLNGTKPAALISSNKELINFKPYIKNKQLSLAEKIPYRDTKMYSYVITLPGEEWRGKEIHDTLLGMRGVKPMSIESIPYHKKLGELLGYSDDDIEHFITRNITSNIKDSAPT